MSDEILKRFRKIERRLLALEQAKPVYVPPPLAGPGNNFYGLEATLITDEQKEIIGVIANNLRKKYSPKLLRKEPPTCKTCGYHHKPTGHCTLKQLSKPVDDDYSCDEWESGK